MTEDDQVRAALAALAEQEPGAAGDPDTERQGSDRDGSGDRNGSSDRADGPPARDRDGESPASYRQVIERASGATEDLAAAAAFVESTGLAELERAVERAEREVSGLAADGREALAAFRAFRAAADGEAGGPDRG